MPDLFIGLVSHSASRFAWNQGEAGLARSLERRLDEAGVTCEVRINVENLLDPASIQLTPKVIEDSLFQELRLEREWQNFLSEGGRRSTSSRLSRQGLHAARWLNAQWRLRGPATLTRNPESTQERALRRLLNIELSHFDLLERALASGAPWALILEDDASTLDIDDAANGLLSLMRTAESHGVDYINVSQSFTREELEVGHLLMPPVSAWEGSHSRQVLPSVRPITNTVCAILYRTAFMQELFSALRDIPRIPVIPIDWKLNEALMNMYRTGSISSGSCWTVFPGPFDQLSMRNPVNEMNGAN